MNSQAGFTTETDTFIYTSVHMYYVCICMSMKYIAVADEIYNNCDTTIRGRFNLLTWWKVYVESLS